VTRREIPAWLPFVLLALVLFTLFHRLLSGQVLFWGLPSLQFYPWRHYAFDQISAGRLPAWNPYVGAGAPLLANYQSALFYPPNWLFLLLPDAQAMGVIAILHVIWAAVGMWLFTGALELTRFGRGVSTLSYALSGYLIARFGSFPTADAGAWLPWLFWLVHLIITRRHWRTVAWLGVAFGMQLLAGHAQTAWYSSVGLGLYALWQVFWNRRSEPVRRRVRVLALLGVGVLLGAAIAAIQLIPTVEYLRESQRASGLDYETLTNLSYHPLRLITMFSPNFYGTPVDGSFITDGIFFEDATYIGFIPFLCAIAAVVGWRHKRDFLTHYSAFVTVPFWVILALGSLLVATGNYGPLYRLLYDHVPTFDSFREPVRWLILMVFSLSVLAGIGTQHWGRGKWIIFWSRLAAAGGGAMVIMALVFRQYINQDAEVMDVLTQGMIVLGCWMVVAALLTLTQPLSGSRVSPFLWRVAVLAFIAVDLAWASAGLTPTVTPDFYRNFSVSRPQGRIYWFEDYEDDIKFKRFFDLGDYRRARDQWPDVRASLLPNLNMLDRVPALNNFDPLLPDYHARYIDLIEQAGRDAGDLLLAASVSQVYGEVQPTGWQGEAPVFTYPDETPRAWLVPQAVWFETKEKIENALLDPGWDPMQTVILAGQSSTGSDSPVMTTGSITILENSPDQVRCRVETDGAAYLVISNSWYPGWVATVNGQEIPLYRANLMFQAVEIPPGSTDVSLSYHLSHWEAGAGITGLALLVTLGLVLLGSLSLVTDSFRRIPLPED
jgi:hypothetical protein